jgi:toxin ParE1/3/4
VNRRIVIRPRADFDLDEQADFIARDSVAAARRFYEATTRAFTTLASMPELGGSWESRNPKYAELRMWAVRGFEKHVIFYRVIPDGIEIVRVLHSARDLEDAFGEI